MHRTASSQSTSSSDLQGLSDFAAVNFDGASFSSPAMAASYDLTSSVSSSSASNLGTVSPNDLLLQDPFMSAPNSAALTSLTSPSDFNDSPYGDSYDVSPNFGGNDFEAGAHDTWFPLFAQDTTASVAAGPVAGGAITASPASRPVDEIDESETTPSRRKSSGHSRSPSTSQKHSASAGVNASRRREKPLPPIIVDDPSDIVAMKRARNTLAARKSRERKAMRVEELEEKIAKLEAERDHWKKMALGQ
ncbi:General control protein [Sporothrix stenoceras]|uniref:General control protein n=1 Tax=Sporothrix stenoceras TaxID=5173 RepID=A0ABR3ZM71_9PEZI